MEKIKLNLITDHLNEDLDSTWKHFTKVLRPFVGDVYQTLSKSGHFNHEQFENIVQLFFEDLQKTTEDKKDQYTIIAMTVLTEQLLKKAIDYDTYRFRQNRFSAFFNELLHQGYPVMKREATKARSPFYDWYTSLLFDQLIHGEQTSPIEKLVTTWLLCEERENILIKHAEKLIKNNRKQKSFHIKLASLLYLQADDGVHSLTLLRDLQSTLHYSELIDHFLIMEQKHEFEMMKHWFEIFFPYDKPKQGSTLGKLYEEMLIETGTDEEKLTIVWKNWLQQPSFSSYISRVKKCNKKEKEKVLHFIIPQLQADLYRPQTEATYYQIVTEEELFEEGIESLLTAKKEVTTLSPEIEKLITNVMKKRPELLLPFLHQVVERLVQKKSRIHYVEAVHNIKQLKLIYEKLDQQQTFAFYVSGIKRRFKTFRAFIQELKKID
ncbi:hypothetical protein BKP35_13855 [Anaerobacillus arseniciselenatis]|uniref:SWIM-type domain-containing protein n=1 Tax=Anaerobacillus arseniciselenatis TaxID=85682 RepID=A0A1S2LCG1_9BACI|nr:hypothetical protein [Anaerobacillus arseniciselenatis]OIJ10189.1 hypothetical protein BKP35_13855 [Anaerobacillus arseniciselenatis]